MMPGIDRPTSTDHDVHLIDTVPVEVIVDGRL